MSVIDEKTIENILMGILLGMAKSEQNLEVKLLAARALLNALQFMNGLLEKENIRLYLLDLIVACALDAHSEVQTTALQVLIDFVKYQYHNLVPNVQVSF